MTAAYSLTEASSVNITLLRSTINKLLNQGLYNFNV